MDGEESLAIGRRIKSRRERVGMSRPVLAGLIGKSAEWLKAVENGGFRRRSFRFCCASPKLSRFGTWPN